MYNLMIKYLKQNSRKKCFYLVPRSFLRSVLDLGRVFLDLVLVVVDDGEQEGEQVVLEVVLGHGGTVGRG